MIQNCMGWSKSSPKREVYSHISLPQEIRKISNKQSNFKPKGILKRRTKPKINRRKEIIKIRAEINEIDTHNNRDQWNEELVL